MKKHLKQIALFFVLTLVSCVCTQAQDTIFWFAAPHNSNQLVAGYELNRPVFLAVSNPNTSSATINITVGGTTIVANQVIPANGFFKKDFTTNAEVATIQNPRSKAGDVVNYGICIKSDIPVTAYYMVNHTDSKDIYTLKGSSALGTSFFVPMQHDEYCPTSYVGGYDQVDIVATEDNTLVTVVPKTKIWKDGTSASAPANTNYIKTLNKGQSLKIMEFDQRGGTLAGTSITATKPIAVSVTEDLVCGDTSGDQIAPVTSLGTRYVVAKGYTIIAADDRMYFVGTENGTTATIYYYDAFSVLKNMSIILNAGACDVFNFDQIPANNKAVYIEATAPIYVFQRTGYNETGCALLPSMYSISQNKVSYHQIPARYEKGVLIFRTGSDGGFKISYDGISTPLAIVPINVPSVTEWKCATFDLPEAANGKVVTISNTQGIFSFGYIAANHPTNNSTSYGYLTAFGEFKFPETSYKCVGEPLTLTAGYAKSYKWWKGKAADKPADGSPLVLGTSNSLPVEEEGFFSVELNLDPKKVIATTYVKNDVLNLTLTYPEFIKVNDNASFSATVTRLEGKVFEWAFTGAVTPTATGASASNIKWATTGSKTITLTVKNPDVGCADEVTTKTVYVYDIIDDYASTVKNKAVTVDVLANDVFPTLPITLAVATNGTKGNASIVDKKVVYTPNPNFVGYDSIRYEVTYNTTHKAYAWLRLSVAEEPDNISSAGCFDTPPGTGFTFNPLSSSPASYTVSNFSIPLVGDIDNDGIMEIIVARAANSNVSMNQLHIFQFKNNTIEHQQTLNTPYFNGVGGAYSIAKVDNNDYAAIFICTNNSSNSSANDKLKLIKYVYNPTTQLYEEFKVGGNTKRGTYSALVNKEIAQPMIVDFNGDGIPEVVTYDKVFNARTMELLVDGQLLQHANAAGDNAMGFGFGGHSNNHLIATEASSIMAIADVTGDGVPEVVGGNCVYKVNITNPNGTANNSFTLWSKCSRKGPGGETHNEAYDGTTAVADMDGDGLLDIIVTVTNKRNLSSTNRGALYVWNPRTGNVMHTNVFNNFPVASSGYAIGPSVAFIGDIDNSDGKNQPEICFTSALMMYAYEFDPTAKTLGQKWAKTTSDGSGATTMVMFDFNQDGNNELVYRDQSDLRILRGVNGSDMIDPPISCTSSTANEYPIVVDINGDGSAEIVVTGGTQVHVYASNPVGMWAPARKVWNQFAYNSVNINEDLSVPKVQFNPATTISGGTCGNVRPYNGYLLQQTTLNKFGCPLFLMPEAIFDGTPAYTWNTAENKLEIKVKVKNIGDADLIAPVYATAYKNSISVTNELGTGSCATNITPNGTGEITINVNNISNKLPITDIRIRLNDKGNNSYPVQKQCRYPDDNTNKRPLAGMPRAVNDTIQVRSNILRNNIDIIGNDSYSCGLSDLLVSIVDPVSTNATTAAINAGKKLDYQSNPNFNSVDKIYYKIQCSGSDDASIAIAHMVIFKPVKVSVLSGLNEAGESGTPKAKLRFEFTDGVTHSKKVEVSYTITPDGENEIQSPAPPTPPAPYKAVIGIGQKWEDVELTAKQNYIVQGNRDVTVTIVDVKEIL